MPVVTLPYTPNTRNGRTYANILEASGNTPLVPLRKLNLLNKLKSKIYVKLEYLNIGGSLHDRTAIEAFEIASTSGLKSGQEVCVAAGGSASVSYAVVAAVRGNKLTVFAPKKEIELVSTLLDTLGVNVVTASATFDEARNTAQQTSKQTGAFYLNDVIKQAAFQAHAHSTAGEIEHAFAKHGLNAPDAIVVPVNTGATVAGIQSYYRTNRPTTKVYGVSTTDSDKGIVPELGADVDVALFNEVEQRQVGAEAAFSFTRDLIASEGIMAGPSSGAAVLEAIEIAKTLPDNSTVVVVLMDGIRNYLQHFLDDDWIQTHKFNIPKRVHDVAPKPEYDPAVLQYDPAKLTTEWKQDDNGIWSILDIPFDKFNPERPEIIDTVLDAIGKTPLVRLNKLPALHGVKANIYVKCEYLNAGGSTKDRIALRMAQIAQTTGRPGKLFPGVTVIEPTSGNTGIGLSLVSAVYGYKSIICMPVKMSKEKALAMESLGSTIIRTPNEAGFDSGDSHIGVSLRLKHEIKDSVILDQYCNPGNPLAHYEQTAEEIIHDMAGKKIDMVVAAAGTGGTVTGLAKKLHEKCPGITVLGVDPHGSILAPDFESQPGFYEVEGIGYDFIPGTLDQNVVDQWAKSHDKESFHTARQLIQLEGILCGGSSGTSVYHALQAAKNLPEDANVVVILPDGVRNYLTKFLDHDWMETRHFLD